MPPSRSTASLTASSATFPDTSLDAANDIALTAAAIRINAQQASRYRLLNQAWQIEAFLYYNSLPECWYPAQFYSHSLPLVRFYAGVKDAQGNVEELPETDWASQQLDRIQDPGGGRSSLMAAYGRLNFLTGDCYLVGNIDGEEEGWEFLSASELRGVPGQRDKFVRVYYPGATPEELQALPDDDYEPLPSGVVVYRFWNRHPEYSHMADAAIRAILPLYQSLALSEAAVMARLRSRIANVKLLILSQDIDFGTVDGQNNDDSSQVAAMRRLQETMVRPIKNPGAASAVAPPILRVPGDMIAAKSVFDLIDLTMPEAYQEVELRNELRNRVALGVDMPAEIVLGLSDANHWNAFQIDESSWNAHLKPVVIGLCDDLGRSFLRPLARQEGKEYDGQLVVWFDESEVVNHPNRTEDVRLAWQDGVAGSSIYRETIGITNEDAQTPEDRELWTLKYGRGRPEDLQAVDAGNLGSDTSQQDSSRNPGNPDTPSQEDIQDQSANVTASGFAEQAVGAAQMAVIRCRALAGSRLRTKLKGECPEVGNGMVASALGLEALPEAPLALVAGGADEYVTYLAASGVEQSLVERIGKLVESHAAATLCEPAPLSEANQAFLRKSLAPLRKAA